MKIVGMDMGYSATKAMTGMADRTVFPSVVGTPDKARFSLRDEEAIVLLSPEHVQVGAGAVSQSRFLNRREDRGWIDSPEWYALAMAALTELMRGNAELQIVTGLPVAFYDDRALVRDRLLGEHRVQREGRRAQTLRVVDCRVIPQPFGALLSATLNNRGQIIDTAMATGMVGVIDVGGKTTNLLSVLQLSEVGVETDSVSMGAWDVASALRRWLSANQPGLENMRDHRLIEAIVARKTRRFGEDVDLGEIVEDTLGKLASQVLAVVSRLWDDAALLDAILVSGGGALLLGPAIQKALPHARVVEDPVFANALGYWRFAQRLSNNDQ